MSEWHDIIDPHWLVCIPFISTSFPQRSSKNSSGWKPTNLTPYLPYGHLFIATSWYYTDGNTDVKYGCLRMLDWLVSTHPKNCSLGIMSWNLAEANFRLQKDFFFNPLKTSFVRRKDKCHRLMSPHKLTPLIFGPLTWTRLAKNPIFLQYAECRGAFKISYLGWASAEAVGKRFVRRLGVENDDVAGRRFQRTNENLKDENIRCRIDWDPKS